MTELSNIHLETQERQTSLTARSPGGEEGGGLVLLGNARWEVRLEVAGGWGKVR